MAAQSKKSKCFQDGHILVHDAEDGEDRDAVWGAMVGASLSHSL